jgi:uncharacterized protein (DUF58 family)
MRRGVIMVEVIVGCALVAVLLALCVQLLSVTALERRGVERRAIALEQAANLIERVSAMPFEQITPQRLGEIKLAEEVEAILPKAAVTWSVADEPGDVPAKRVRVEIAWTGLGGRAESPARLTYWAYPRPQGATP